MEITYAELFTGIGGFRYGLEKANSWNDRNQQANILLPRRQEAINSTRNDNPQDNGSDRCIDKTQSQSHFKCIWANEWDKYACQIYRKNFGDKELVEGNIRTVNPSTIPAFDLLTAGFPCQSFSLAGKRRGFEDTRGTLFYEVARIAEAKRPRLLLLENVKGLLSNDRGRTFAKIIQTLDELGYDVEWQVLNSKYFGVPQNRERVFIIGHSRAEPTRQIFPIGEPNSISVKNASNGQRIASCLDANYHKGARRQRTFVIQEHSFSGKDGKGRGLREFEGIVPTLTQQMGTGGNNVPMVTQTLNKIQRSQINIAKLVFVT